MSSKYLKTVRINGRLYDVDFKTQRLISTGFTRENDLCFEDLTVGEFYEIMKKFPKQFKKKGE